MNPKKLSFLIGIIAVIVLIGISAILSKGGLFKGEISQPLPDIYYVGGSAQLEGENVLVSARITNPSSVNITNGFRVNIYADNIQTNLIKTEIINSLPAGQLIVLPGKNLFETTFPQSLLTPGDHNIFIVADATKVVSESNEENNSGGPYPIKIPQKPFIDLSAQASSPPYFFNLDGDLVVNYVIKNQGNIVMDEPFENLILLNKTKVYHSIYQEIINIGQIGRTKAIQVIIPKSKVDANIVKGTNEIKINIDVDNIAHEVETTLSNNILTYSFVKEKIFVEAAPPPACTAELAFGTAKGDITKNADGSATLFFEVNATKGNTTETSFTVVVKLNGQEDTLFYVPFDGGTTTVALDTTFPAEILKNSNTFEVSLDPQNEVCEADEKVLNNTYTGSAFAKPEIALVPPAPCPPGSIPGAAEGVCIKITEEKCEEIQLSPKTFTSLPVTMTVTVTKGKYTGAFIWVTTSSTGKFNDGTKSGNTITTTLSSVTFVDSNISGKTEGISVQALGDENIACKATIAYVLNKPPAPGTSGGGGYGGGSLPLPSAKDLEIQAKLKAAAPKLSLVCKKEPTFIDVKKHWSKENICILFENNIVSGYSQSFFGPDDKLTRAQMVKIALNAMNIETKEVTYKPFNDTAPKAWYTRYVAKAKELGIVKGYAGDVFLPDRPVTRAEAMKILFEASKLTKLGKFTVAGPIPAKPFKDIIGNEWFAAYIAQGYAGKVVSGYNDGTFRPNSNVTRGEMSKMAVNFLKNILKVK